MSKAQELAAAAALVAVMLIVVVVAWGWQKCLAHVCCLEVDMQYVTRRRKVKALLCDGNDEEIIKFGRGFIQADHEGLWMGVMPVHQGWYLVDDDILGLTLYDKETFNRLYAMPRKIARDSKTGRFTTKQYAQDNPDTTQEKTL